MISYIYVAKPNIMKIVLSLSVLILLLSCGKYKRPFITFKSPEKRLTESTWKCVKVVDADGDPFFCPVQPPRCPVAREVGHPG